MEMCIPFAFRRFRTSYAVTQLSSRRTEWILVNGTRHMSFGIPLVFAYHLFKLWTNQFPRVNSKQPLCWSLVAHQAEAHSVFFNSMKRLGVFLLPLDGMLVQRIKFKHDAIYKWAGHQMYVYTTRGYSWVWFLFLFPECRAKDVAPPICEFQGKGLLPVYPGGGLPHKTDGDARRKFCI